MHRKRKSRSARGFTLIEVMVAMAILAAGILSVAGIFAKGLQASYETQIEYIAEQKAQEAMETIFTARDTKVITFSQIANVSAGGVFLDGGQPLCASGPDGLFGTQDDITTQPDTVVMSPGADKMFGTSDDVGVNLNPWMTRTIKIEPTSTANLDKITVTINWTYAGQSSTYQIVSYISDYS
jgi:prepilin-type N-terminal cleavage/methylation domain-containing protein